ncbi:metallophosphoesterase [Priestia koreensis]|uniref:metallophosphoesterase n=1 Tax=Priestia koreensis TaxID=284581 RepID=UPI001F56AF91|nr:metallophosphoesterase [Priestia koreensis]MCM3005438.1 metallophosphoesterase [Priestia koreensis]UNL86647.1 metallophosphoesterase [Priestia koreensis]
MRKFVISDIHGSYREMMQLFEHAAFDPETDQLVVVGDMMNRGPDSGPVLKEIKRLHETYENVHVTIGNHEEMMLWYIGNILDMWLQFGAKEAADSINETFSEPGEVADLLEWLRTLPMRWDDDEYVYSHAGFEIPYGDTNRENLWMKRKDLYRYSKQQILDETGGKTLVHGHTPIAAVTFDGARLAIDLGAQVVSKRPKLALVELTEFVAHVYDFDQEMITTEPIKRGTRSRR